MALAGVAAVELELKGGTGIADTLPGDVRVAFHEKPQVDPGLQDDLRLAGEFDVAGHHHRGVGGAAIGGARDRERFGAGQGDRA